MTTRSHAIWAGLIAISLGASCSSDGDGGDDTPTPSAGGGGAVGGGQGAGAPGGAGGGGGRGEDPCEPFGRFSAPENTFVLPTDTTTSYPDLQAAFPEVDWARLDRLYIPAGDYPSLNLGGLPDRDPSRPLVITNLGGQVRIGPNDDGNFIWSMSGGSHWVLTGRYDPVAQTGDASVPGHRCADYPNARGQYGFLSDDAFDLDAPFLHMGLGVSDASDVEIEFIEVMRSGFAGIRMLNDPLQGRPMANVNLHDTYVHDVAGEGIYLGWTGGAPSSLIPGLEVHHNRFVRTGNEALQVQNLGDGSHIHHNVMAYAALHWRDNELGAFQDFNGQIQMRTGSVVIEKNFFIGAASTLWSSFRTAEAGDGPLHVVYRDNYVSDNRIGLAAFLGGEAGSASSYRFEGNVFRRIDFSYDEIDPGATDARTIFRFAAGVTAPVVITGQRWEGEEALVAGLDGPNGTVGNVTATDNQNTAVEPASFVDALTVDPRVLEYWTARQSRAPNNPVRAYAPGDVVVATDGHLYRATAANSNAPPPTRGDVWERLADPTDDFRVAPGSTYLGWGIDDR
ncbi:MAG: right-handed parallel beta-helix repeat-containing protein [Myxococcota bacterium]